ncbi:hypothetical protein OPQ81_000282 [Rhizoctonia solani]|nr:hypothetical protein OPQ81_000282 [Rhizoctonia solani]
MNNIEKITNEPNPVPRMTPSFEGTSPNEPTLPGYNDSDLDPIDDDEKTTKCCCSCRCADASCDGYGGLQSILACFIAIPLAAMACCTGCC